MIRRYQDADLNGVLTVWEHASRLAHPFLGDAFLANEREQIATVWLAHAETWVYSRDAHVVGFISLIGNEVGGLFVDPRFHGHGFGRALVDHAASLRSTLEVEVFEANHIGRRFYDRYGFEETEQSVDEPTGRTVLRLQFRPSRTNQASPGA